MTVPLSRLFSRRPAALADPDRLTHNKLCNVEDFAHPELAATLRAMFPHELNRFGPGWPTGREYRKHWEVAMAARALGNLGVLHDRAEVLGVGAGHEPTIFWLTTKVGRVFATDLYLEPGIWSEFANSSMLADPGQHWPSSWNPRRLVAQHMNGLDLRYDDGSFDAIFSSSSIEHFGTQADVRRAASEMCRVLKPGGVLSISTEFRLEGPPPGPPGLLLFDASRLPIARCVRTRYTAFCLFRDGDLFTTDTR
jgi:SAM-dependent methyltransferase